MPHSDLNTPPRLTPIALIYAATVATLLLLFYLGTMTLAGVRGFVGGESTWSKAQKQAVSCLQRYAVGRSEADYACYLEHRGLIASATAARRELQKGRPDMFAAYRYLEGGGADPEDAPAMATVFRWFSGQPLMRDAVRYWELGDREVAIMDSLALEIRENLAAQRSHDGPQLAAVLLALREHDQRITSIENAFSRSMGVSARSVARMLMVIMTIAGLLMLILAVYFSSRWISAWKRTQDLAGDRAARMRVVAEAAADVGGAATLPELDRILRSAFTRVLDLDASTFGRYNAETGNIEFLPGRSDGVDVPAVAVPIVGTPSERFLSDRSSFMVSTSSDPEGRGSFQNGNGVPSESVIRCPMYSGDRLLGMVAVHSYTPHMYTPDDVEVMEALAAVAASAIERIDSTREKQSAEEQLRLSQEKLAQAHKMEAVGLLAGGIAHDFNNLLTAIRGNSDLIAGDPALPDELRDHIDEIAAAADRATALTRQLLAFSRKQVLQPRVLDLNSLVRNMTTLIHRLIGEDVALVTALEPELGNVRADPHQMEQVILNLTLNGRDAMAGGGSLRIETGNITAPLPDVPSLEAGEYVMLGVRDSGAGMSPESRERIFEPFFTTKGVGKGTGLGLSTVYGIVNQSGGHIHVVSAPGEGTAMQIFLPSTTDPVDDPLPDESGRHPDVAPACHATILVVEDEATVRTLLSRVLGREGYTVLEAASGPEALALLRANFNIELMITDIVMPGMNGIALAKHALDLCPELSVLHMSGYTEDEVFRRGLSSRGLAFLQKPFAPAVLVAAVQEALAARTVESAV